MFVAILLLVARSVLTLPKDIKGDWKKLGSGSFGNVYKGAHRAVLEAASMTLTITRYLSGHRCRH